MKQIILLILFSSFSFAYKFELNNNDINFIKNSSQKKYIINRLKKYIQIKKEAKEYSLPKKMNRINSFVNKILPALDKASTQYDDYWASPKEFLFKGYGDCEDYVITKYFTFVELGLNKRNLYFAVVDVKGSKTAHMVLLYKDSKIKSPLVLDNLSFRILPLNKRSDLKAKYAFNEYDSFKLNKEGFTRKVKINWGKEDKWNKLLKKVYKDKE